MAARYVRVAEAGRPGPGPLGVPPADALSAHWLLAAPAAVPLTVFLSVSLCARPFPLCVSVPFPPRPPVSGLLLLLCLLSLSAWISDSVALALVRVCVPVTPQVGRTFDPATAFVVDDLKPNTEYAFRLAARSPQGLGAFTAPVRQRTLPSSRCLAPALGGGGQQATLPSLGLGRASVSPPRGPLCVCISMPQPGSRDCLLMARRCPFLWVSLGATEDSGPLPGQNHDTRGPGDGEEQGPALMLGGAGAGPASGLSDPWRLCCARPATLSLSCRLGPLCGLCRRHPCCWLQARVTGTPLLSPAPLSVTQPRVALNLPSTPVSHLEAAPASFWKHPQ